MSNIFSNLSATLINLLAPLLIIPILTSGLGMNEYGIYVTLLAKTALFIVFAELGFGMYFAKEISVNRDDISEVSSLFWIFMVTKLVTFVIVLIIFIFFSDQFGVVESLLCGIIFVQFVNMSPILTGLENYKFLAKLQLFTKFIFVVAALMINFSDFGLEKALIIQVSTAALTSFSLFIYFIKNNKLEKTELNLNKFKVVMKGSLPFYGAKLFVNLYQQSSTYFVSFVLSAELVAIYSISIQLYKVGQAVIGSVAGVLYTSTVKTKNFLLIYKLTIRSFIIHISVFPIIFFYGEQILSLVFSFDVIVLVNLSIILYLSLLSVIFSSYWGYPALSAIGKENYAHIGILVASLTYFIAFGMSMAFEWTSIYMMVGCIVLSDFMGMLVRLYYAKQFKLI